ncbi:MAG TPA: type II secretory protein PulD [Acidobacteriaceae bacterium]|jgi:hypothetical protein
MQYPTHRRSVRRFFTAAALGILPFGVGLAYAQETPSAPASVPAGAASPISPAAISASKAAEAIRHPVVTSRQAREAEDAYIDGARRMERNDLAGAERGFARAVELNPAKQEYVLALAMLREHRLTALVQSASKARLAGNTAEADKLLKEARAIDPDNTVVTQHVANFRLPVVPVDAQLTRGGMSVPLGGPIQFQPRAGKQSIHTRGGAQELIRTTFRAFGIEPEFDATVTGNAQARLDLDDVDFNTAKRVVLEMTHTFAVPLQPNSALIAKDNRENRDRLQPQIEETIYMPGLSAEAMNEMATMARNVFEIQHITPSVSGGDLLVRGDASTLNLLNATYADMLGGDSDVMLDVRLYELDKSRTRNIGIQTPSSIGAFSVASEALNILNANQTLIQQAIANGLVLTGNPNLDRLIELEFLLKSGIVKSTQFSNLLGTVGTLEGLPLLGIFAGSATTFNLLLNASEVRTLDDVQLRAGNGIESVFRSGTRYPIVTATYTSGISSGLASQLSGVNVNGSSVASLLAQFQGASSATVPQVQYEDLGVTLKAKPRIMRDGAVYLELDMKIEALGGGSLNSIPILNSREIKSNITIPAGQTALLASTVNRNEIRSIDGVPGLSELPGFQGTDKSTEVDTGELLITVTPHIVRSGTLRFASKRLAVERTQPPTSGGSQ